MVCVFLTGRVLTGEIAAGSGLCGDPTITGERVVEDVELVHCLLPGGGHHRADAQEVFGACC